MVKRCDVEYTKCDFRTNLLTKAIGRGNVMILRYECPTFTQVNRYGAKSAALIRLDKKPLNNLLC